MCRHICPIGNATGQERNTSRARALSLSLVERGGAELNADLIDNVYECALCGACTKECVTGWDPVLFTKETRLEAALTGKMPSYIEKMLDNYDSTGNIYGENSDIKERKTGADTLLFIGMDARIKCADKVEKAMELLEKAGVSFDVLADEPNSGYAFDFLLGGADETRKVMENCAKALDYKKIVCYDVCDAKVFLREYKEWGINLRAEVVTFTEYLSRLIADGKLKLKKSDKEYTLQDPALLARDLEDSESPRAVLSACGRLKEMLLFGKDTMLAGNLIMNEYMPKVMRLVAENRWANAAHIGAKTLVTACPAEYVLLRETKPEDIELITIEEAVLQCL